MNRPRTPRVVACSHCGTITLWDASIDRAPTCAGKQCRTARLVEQLTKIHPSYHIRHVVRHPREVIDTEESAL